MLSRHICLPALLLPWLCAAGQNPLAPGASDSLSAEVIMARVAANQDHTETERAHYVYVQHAHVQSRKGSTVMCDEVTDTRITPSAIGQQQAMLALSGHVRAGKRVIHYTALPVQPKEEKAKGSQKDGDGDTDIEIGDKTIVLDADANNAPVGIGDTDVDLVENMRHNFTSDKKAKDGVGAGLFPLTSDQQKDMLFELKGREPKNGHDTYHVVFRPKDKDDFGWKGDAWIDAEAFQPVVVRTALSRSIPLGVRMLLGTNVPGLGFTVIYAPQGQVWFPASFGTEFKIRVLFAFHREIIVDVQNRSFERTHVTSTVHTEEAKPVTASPEATAPKP